MSLHQHHPYLHYQTVMQHYPPPPQSPAQPPAAQLHSVQQQQQHQQHQQQAQQQQQQQQTQQQSPTPTPAATIAPTDTYNQHTTVVPQNQPQTTQGQNPPTPLVAQGDWTKNLVHLAKTAELKKHALTLQLHTAHILSAHTQLEAKNKALQDVKEEKNRLESERARLLNCLRQVNEDRDKADLLESTINKECSDLRGKIQVISDGEYATAKREVDALRAELGQPPMPTLQQTLADKSSAYLAERRLNGAPVPADFASPASASAKRTAVESPAPDAPIKRPRGRPKGSKNRKSATAAGGSSGAGGLAGGEVAGE